jgi:hypothetical protein
MASGTNSWNTGKVVIDEYGLEGPLLTVEMERLMGLNDDYTFFKWTGVAFDTP